MGSYPVSLSIIGSLQQVCEAFFWGFIGKPQKTRFFDVSWPKTEFSANESWLFLLAHLLQSNGQLSCKFEHHWIFTAKLRSVFLEFHRKTLENPFFRRFLAQNRIFCKRELPFFIGTPSTTKWAAIL